MLLAVQGKEPESDAQNSAEAAGPPARRQLFQNVIKASDDEDRAHGRTLAPKDFAIPKDFFFPDDATFDVTAKKNRDNTIFGIDVSHYDGKNLNLTALRQQKVDFVYAKATQGITFQDDAFERYWKGIAVLQGNIKVLRGAYHFLTAKDDAKEQAKHFVEFVNSKGGLKPDDMPPCVDLEWDVDIVNKIPDRWKGQSPDQILGSLIAWLKEAKALTGRTPIIYTARSWWLDRGIPKSKFDLLKDYNVWIADYSRSHKAIEKPALIDDSRQQSLWQFADDALLRIGYAGKLDASIFYGSRDEFLRTFGVQQ
jgi:lysozyme